MSNAPLGTIAALLRHSGIGLVKRYAHLSPDHLRNAVEMVAAFGKEPERRSQKETVTGPEQEAEAEKNA